VRNRWAKEERETAIYFCGGKNPISFPEGAKGSLGGKKNRKRKDMISFANGK